MAEDRKPGDGPPAENRPAAAAPPHFLSRAFDRLSVDALRYEAAQLVLESRATDDLEQQCALAERAFELAQAAERLDHSQSPAPASPAANSAAAAVAANENLDPRLERARRWRMRAEEYRTVAEAMQTPMARDTYLRLARAYDGLAARTENWALRMPLAAREGFDPESDAG